MDYFLGGCEKIRGFYSVKIRDKNQKGGSRMLPP
jgi:hypothetical protein